MSLFLLCPYTLLLIPRLNYLTLNHLKTSAQLKTKPMKRGWCVWVPWFDMQLEKLKSYLWHLKPWHPDITRLSNTRFDVLISNKITYMRKLSLEILPAQLKTIPMKRVWCVWVPWSDMQLENRKSSHLRHLKPWHPDTIRLSNTRFEVVVSNKITYMRKLN